MFVLDFDCLLMVVFFLIDVNFFGVIVVSVKRVGFCCVDLFVVVLVMVFLIFELFF